MHTRALRHRAPALWLLLPFMAGLALARTDVFPDRLALLLVSAALAWIAACWKRENIWVFTSAFSLALIASGAAFYHLRRERRPERDELPPREIQLTLSVERLFASRTANKVSGLGRVAMAQSTNDRDLLGQRVYFSARVSPDDRPLVPSAWIEVRGVLSPLPRSAAPTTFDGFLDNAGVNFRLNRARIARSVREPTAYRRFCADTQRRLGAILSRGLERHPELSAVYRAMVLGEITDLTEEQSQLYRESGTMHLFSISGLHIAAIAVALHMLLGVVRLRGWLKLGAIIGLLWLYVDITGSSPSAVRAFGMVALLETAFVIRRSVNPVATLALSAFISLLFDPMQLFGASFQMSYGIVAALLLLGLPLAEHWEQKTAVFRDLPKVTWTWRQRVASFLQRMLASALGIGVATALVSSIAGVLYFQLFTPGALLANLVLIPASSLALWSGFLSLLCGLLGASWLSSVFNHAAALTLWLMERGIHAFLVIPGVFVHAEFRAASVGFIAFAGLIIALLVGYAAAWENRLGRWWPPFVWTALALTIGARF